MLVHRRTFLNTALCLGSGVGAVFGERVDLRDEVGLVAASLAPHMEHRQTGGMTLLDLPRRVREELEIRVLDMNTMNFPSLEPRVVEGFRVAAENVGCVLTNLKMNQPGIDLSSPDDSVRQHGLQVFRDSIDAAARMGMLWVRPLPARAVQDRSLLLGGMRELADYAGERGIGVLVENFGWMQDDPNSVATLIRDGDCGLLASPDTGNWSSNEVRYPGLEASFPLAVTCDFKAKELTPEGDHPAYDLRRCFRIGVEAGFRGPWCIEHGHRDPKVLWGNLRSVRDQLRQWIAYN